MVDVDAVLDRLPSLAGRPRTVERLPGGLTNTNLKVSTPERTVVVRLSARESGLLGIDRDAECAGTRAAHDAGVGAPVVEYVPELNALVIGYLDGTTLYEDDLRASGMLPRIAASCRALHAGPAFVREFDMFDVAAEYLRIVRDNGFRLPDRYLEFLPTVDRIRDALSERPEPKVPCNNDLLPENFIDDGDRVWLIDYEYAGNNEACFELGNVVSEAHLDDDALGELVTAYYGRPLRHKIARARLFGLMSKYGWTLWASIQDAMSTIDFDFWSWGMDKYDRAVAEFDGPDLERLLTDVRRTD